MKMPFYTFSKRSFGLRATYLHEQGYNRALAAKESDTKCNFHENRRSFERIMPSFQDKCIFFF